MTDRIKNSQQGVRAEPKFLRDPTSLESLSSGISRISSYVASNLPKKRTSLPSFLSPFDPQYNPQYMYGVPQGIAGVSMSPDTSESHVPTSMSTDHDNTSESQSTPTFASFGTLSIRRKDQKGQTRIKCLMIGYQDGFQIWDINNPDNIHELCSTRDDELFSNVTAIHSLVTPRKDRIIGKESDAHEMHRPLIAVVSNHPLPAENPLNEPQDGHHSESPLHARRASASSTLGGQTKCRVQIYSLRTHQVVKTLDSFDNDDAVEITGIQSNDRVIVLASITSSRSKIHLLSAASLEQFTPSLTDVFHEPGKSVPFTLGSRFLAYATSTPVLNATHNVSPGSGGISGAGLGVLSGEKDVKDAAKEVAKEVVNGVKALSEYGYQTLSNYFTGSPSGDMSNAPPVMANTVPRRELPYNLKDPNERTGNGHSPSSARKGPYGGMIMVRDILKLPSSPTRNLSASVLAHYRPHSHPIMFLSFNAAGTLLMSVSNQGHTFHVFSILPSGTHTGSTAHLYSLLRGYTDAQVEDSKFSTDSMWCAVSTARGTTHLYAINPDGGRPEILGHVRGKARNSYAGFAVPRGGEQPKPVSQGPAVRIKQRTPMPTPDTSKVDTGVYNPTTYPPVIHPAYTGQSPPFAVPHPIPTVPFSNEPKIARAKLITTFLSTTKPTYLFRGNQSGAIRQPIVGGQKPSIVNMNTLASLTSPSLRQIRDKASSLGSMISNLSGATNASPNSSPQQKARSSWIHPNDKNADNRVFGFEEEETSLEDDATKVIGDEIGYQDMYSFHPSGILTLHRCCIATGIARRRENGRLVERIELSVRQEDIAEWRVARGPDWDEIHVALETIPAGHTFNHAGDKNGHEHTGKSKKGSKRQDAASVKKDGDRSRSITQHAWLSNAEISTYPVTPDDHNLWSLPQFSFQMYDEGDITKVRAVLTAGKVPPTNRLVVRRDMPEPISRRVGRVNKTMARNGQREEDGNLDEALAELEDNLSKAMQTNFSSSPHTVLGSSPIGTKRMASSAGSGSHMSRPVTERVPSLSFEDAYLISMGGGTGFENVGSPLPGSGFTPPTRTSVRSNENDQNDAMQNSSLIRFDDDELVSADFDMDSNDAVQVVADNSSQGVYNTILQGDQVFSPDGDNEVAYPSDSVILQAEMPESI